jgi:peptidoglycan/xylan/chitin deacetylase (PgdA/CDA1 family)
VHKNSRETDRLLTKQEVLRLIDAGKPFISVASHGWTHKSCDLMTMDEFEESVRAAEAVLDELPAKAPFFAFASGRFTPAQVSYLRDRKLVPVFVDGKDNVKDPASIHRFCIDEGKIHG